MKFRDNSTAFYIFLAALAARLIYVVFFFGLSPVPDPDSVDYLNYATNLLAGHGYTDGQWRAFRAPGYPFFIAAVYYIFGQSIPALKIAQVILGSLVPVLVYLIGTRVTTKKAAVLSGFFACFYFGFVIEPVRVLSEATFTFLFALSILLLLDTQKHKAYAAAAGAAVALTALTRPVGLLMTPLAAVWLLLSFPPRKALKLITLGLIAFVAVMSPWWIRNYRTFGVFVPVCVETGFVLQGTRVPLELRNTNENLPEIERDRKSVKEGIAYLKTQSIGTHLKAGVLTLAEFLYPFMPEYDLTYALIFPLWLFGVFFVLRSKNIQALPLFFMFLYFPVAFVFCGTARHRHSMGPYFILLAAIGAEEIARRVKEKGSRRAAWSAAGAWAALNLAILIYSEPLRLLLKRLLGR